MKNSEEITTEILAGLRDVEAPAGMEGRILKALREREATARVKQPLWQSWTVRSAVASAVCVALAFSAIHRTKHAPAMAKSPSQPAGTSHPVAPAISAQATEPPPPRNRTPRHVTGTLAPAAPDTTQAASYPAPPMPLTEQERLLLRIVHKGDPVELAMLDPVQRTAHNAEEKAAFQNFFEPPDTKGNE